MNNYNNQDNDKQIEDYHAIYYRATVVILPKDGLYNDMDRKYRKNHTLEDHFNVYINTLTNYLTRYCGHLITKQFTNFFDPYFDIFSYLSSKNIMASFENLSIKNRLEKSIALFNIFRHSLAFPIQQIHSKESLFSEIGVKKGFAYTDEHIEALRDIKDYRDGIMIVYIKFMRIAGEFFEDGKNRELIPLLAELLAVHEVSRKLIVIFKLIELVKKSLCF